MREDYANIARRYPKIAFPDGFIIDSLKKELNESNYYNKYDERVIKYGGLYFRGLKTAADKGWPLKYSATRNLGL
jgi:hypothetical protein